MTETLLQKLQAIDNPYTIDQLSYRKLWDAAIWEAIRIVREHEQEIKE